MNDGDTYTIRRFTAADRAAWAELWAGYLTFYRTQLDPSISEQTWRRILASGPIFAYGAWKPSGMLAAFVHYLMHPTTWTANDVCYLEDLFVAPSERKRGVARALIAAVAADARAREADKVYWLTQETNAAGRRLYDRVARYNGFIRYDHAINEL